MDPVEELKLQLAVELVRAIDGWTPGQLIYRITIDQPRVSDLRRGRLERISLARLIRWLAEMGFDVDLTVERANAGRR
ncbi:MAG: XRE family transcriptional regulator [Gemmatimonadaceae bacterium]